jgi:hypothetical protein
MSHKKAIKEPLDTEQAKDLELDEEPTPTRKVSKPFPCVWKRWAKYSR